MGQGQTCVPVVTDCIFCKIASGHIPATLIKHSDNFVAFRDIGPQAPTHVLAVPREHFESLNTLNDAGLAGELLLFAKDVAAAEGLSERGYRLVINTNRDGGQTDPHLHVHVLGGRAMTWPPG